MEGNVNLNSNGNFNSEVVNDILNKDKVTASKFYSKVFLYFGLGVLLTSVVTLLLSWIFQVTMLNNGGYGEFFVTYMVILIASFITLLVLDFVIQARVMKNNKSVLVPYLLYSTIYGVLFGAIAALIDDPMVLGVSLLMTSLLFLSMCGFGYLSHNKMNALLKIVSTLFIAVMLLCLINFLILPFALFSGDYDAYFAYGLIYWVIEAVVLIAFLLLTAIDFARIRKIAEHGAQNENIALFCALNIYSDFITIFLYILRFVLIFSRRD